MHASRYALAIAAAAVIGAAPLSAQRARVSPHETISAKIEGNRVTIVYGRPYSKDSKTGVVRKIWGSLVPYGEIWRTGADEATLLITQKDIVLGGTTIPAGAYTLFTLPAEDGSAKLIFNKQIGQWGIDPYDEKQELARIDLTRTDLKPADPAKDVSVPQFTMSLGKNPAGGGVLKMTWETTQYSVAYTVRK